MMYQTKIVSVNGKQATNDEGKTLYRIGNMPVAPGDYVWTDGKAVYGWFQDTDPPRPWLPPVLRGILYRDDSTLYNYRRTLITDEAKLQLVDGYECCWGYDLDGHAVNLKTGDSYTFNREIGEFGHNGCVNASGELLISTRYRRAGAMMLQGFINPMKHPKEW